MGKNSAIDSLSKLIANTVTHKILTMKTLRKESMNFLEKEEVEYRSQAVKQSQLFNWNKEDVAKIKDESFKKVQNKFQNKYTDIEISEEEIEKFINEEIDEILKIE